MTEQRVNRLNDIVHVVIGARYEGGVTRREIADRVGLKKSPYLNGLIQMCIDEGLIWQNEVITSWPHRFVYFPKEEALRIYSHVEK